MSEKEIISVNALAPQGHIYIALFEELLLCLLFLQNMSNKNEFTLFPSSGSYGEGRDQNLDPLQSMWFIDYIIVASL